MSADFDHSALMKDLKTEFLEELEEDLQDIETLLDQAQAETIEPKEGMVQLQRIVHSVKGAARVVEYQTIALILHRLEDYLSVYDALLNDEKMLEDIQGFIDMIYGIKDQDQAVSVLSEAEVVRRLPHKHVIHENPVQPAKKSDIEALLVMKEQVASRLFERELDLAGLRVSTTHSSFDAIYAAVHTKPNFIAISAMLDELSGIDLMNALQAMEPTKNIPVVLLANSESDQAELKALPEQVTIIDKKNIKEQLRAALQDCGLV